MQTQQKSQLVSDWRIWVMAIRPKTLTLTIGPVLLGTALAHMKGVPISWLLSLFALLSAFHIQIGTNLVNDALDFKKGADTPARLGPVRVTQSGLLTANQVLAGGLLCYLMALILGLPLMFSGGPPLIIVLCLSVIAGYCYTGGPWPLAYNGLSEFFVLLFFGLIATAAVYYVQVGELSVPSIVAGAQCGLLSVAVLAINNLRDLDEDAMTNKRTLAVRFGKYFGRIEISLALFLPFILGIYWISEGILYAGVLPLLSLPIALKLAKGIWSHEPSRIYNQYLGMGGLLHLIFSLMLTLSIFSSKAS